MILLGLLICSSVWLLIRIVDWIYEHPPRIVGVVGLFAVFLVIAAIGRPRVKGA